MPSSWRATRETVPTWQDLKVGDRTPDYGGKHDYLEVLVMDAPNTLIYRTERFGTTFTSLVAGRVCIETSSALSRQHSECMMASDGPHCGRRPH